MQQVQLSKIRIDGGTQPRAAIDEDTVAQYGEDLTALPPVELYHDGADYWLADGFHRYHAHAAARAKTIPAKVHKGTRRDAVLHSVGANATHGLRRTNADKRRAVETLLADAEWAKWSDRKLAEACAVGRDLVASVRGELSGRIGQMRERTVARAGTTYTQDTTGVANANAARTPASPPAAEPADSAEDDSQPGSIDVDDAEPPEPSDDDGAGRPEDGPADKDDAPADPPQAAPEMKPEPTKPARPAYMELADVVAPLVEKCRQLVLEMERACGRQRKRGEPDFAADGTYYLTPRHFDNLRNGLAHVADALPAGPKRGNPGYECAAGMKALAAGRKHAKASA